MAYHHVSLRTTLLTTAAQALTEAGPAALSLRELARRAGVSHAAPAHHFGDKAGLFTAIAAQGFDLLADALHAARDDGFLDVGVAYVRFAITHRAHFELMFQPALYRADDTEVVAARARARDELRVGSAELRTTAGTTSRAIGLASWSMAHGFASLWLSGAMTADLGDNPETVARIVLGSLGSELPRNTN